MTLTTCWNCRDASSLLLQSVHWSTEEALPGRSSHLCGASIVALVTTAPDPLAEWWTTSDVAAFLGVGIGTVSTYRARGQMPAPDMTLGRTHVWRPARIIEWHDARPRPGVGGRPLPEH